jgi:hypothetical protein
MIDRNHPGFNDNAEPFFTVVMKGLAGAVDGPHFWDTVAHDAVFEFIYTFPGLTPRIEGRSAYMETGSRTIPSCFIRPKRYAFISVPSRLRLSSSNTKCAEQCHRRASIIIIGFARS